MNYRVEYRDQNWIAADIEATSPTEAAEIYLRHDTEMRWQDYDKIDVWWGRFGKHSESFLIREFLPSSPAPPKTRSEEETVPLRDAVTGTTSLTPGRQTAVAVGGILGGVVGWYCGWHLVVPLALAFGVGWLLTKIPGSPVAFRIAWALVAARAIYLTADIVLGGGLPDAIHILVLGVGLAWLWLRPGIGPVILLGLYGIATTVLIVIAYGRAQPGSWQHKALVAYLCLQSATVLFLISGYVKTRRRLILPPP